MNQARLVVKHVMHGMSKTGTYAIWGEMVKRCRHHARYAGRGIKVCERWRIFSNFLADMGERPRGLSLDRFPDNDGNYEPGNCRWATSKEQANNTRANRNVTIGDRTQTLAQWADEFGISYVAVYCRIGRGWPIEVALNKPVGYRFRPVRERRPEVAGENSSQAKLTADQVLAIRADSKSSRKIAPLYRVSSATITAIRRREKWAYI